MSEFRHRVGARIRERRVDAGLSQRELAQRVARGMESGQVSRWERGESFPSYDHLRGLARALRCSEEALLSGLQRNRR